MATILSTLVGFAGIILTLVVQRHQSLELERVKETRARQRLLVALRTEIRGIVEYAERGCEGLDGDADFLFPKQAPFVLFDALADRLDLLEIGEIELVTSVYIWLREIPQRLSLLANDTTANAGYFPVPRSRVEIVRFLFTHLGNTAKEADQTLTKALQEISA